MNMTEGKFGLRRGYSVVRKNQRLLDMKREDVIVVDKFLKFSYKNRDFEKR